MKKQKTNIFLKLLFLLFIFYVILSIVEKTGYYERRISKRTSLTEQKILEFENDVANNKVVGMESYLPERKDYSNSVTKSASFISKKIGTLLNTHFDGFFDFIKTLFVG